MFETIMTIAGKPGLYRMLSRGNNMFIVETVDATHKRLPVYNSDKIVLLDDIANFGAMNEVYAEYFKADKPARVCYQVAALPKGAKVEIDAVAGK